MAARLKTSLGILGYSQAQTFDPADFGQLVPLVVWLENRKVRGLAPEKRGMLQPAQAAAWFAGFREYLGEIGCHARLPATATVQPLEWYGALEWLVHYAVTLEYRDGAAAIKQSTAMSAVASQAPVVLDASLPAVADQVRVLTEALGLGTATGTDPTAQLHSCLSAIVRKFGSESGAGRAAQAPVLDAASLDVGVDTGDALVDAAARILRLLYVEDMRHLQSQINDLIVTAQNYTADPKTDARLGKVGV
eukprot:TRINITY_DN14912_c0_g1_i1.p1 TRINITY_DN14912_c0_g1~~TRINITY_DN14912_c0_g1_i1.p1  ORF type:complete len:269 (+),score=56.42 TRINITY_DN14912_c0_g1_i1:61-807(+)